MSTFNQLPLIEQDIATGRRMLGTDIYLFAAKEPESNTFLAGGAEFSHGESLGLYSLLEVAAIIPNMIVLSEMECFVGRFDYGGILIGFFPAFDDRCHRYQLAAPL